MAGEDEVKNVTHWLVVDLTTAQGAALLGEALKHLVRTPGREGREGG